MAKAVTIVVEWEQARRQEQSRSLTMLRRLTEEISCQADGMVNSPAELIVCVDESDLDQVRTVILSALARDAELFEVRFVPANNLDYYALKNLGAAEATGDLIVFLDSDVVPEPGWLGNLLAPFEDPEVLVVSGNTYVEITGIYSRTFALTWSFPLRSDTDDVGPMSTLRANNLAFRRETVERFPFPSMPEVSRRSCQLLKQSMIRARVNMVTAAGARVAHPAPAPPQQFLVRALSQGRDRVLLAEPGRDRTWRGARRRLWLDLTESLRRLWGGRRRAGLSLPALPLAAAICTSFLVCSTLGELLTMVNRSFMVRHFRV